MAGNGRERRRHERVAIDPLVGPIEIRVQSASGHSETWKVQPRDLSRRGMAFEHPKALAAGSRCVVLITHGHRPLRIVGLVANCRKTAEHTHLVGVKFISILPVPGSVAGPSLSDDPRVEGLLLDVQSEG